ncbi:hypothetical protein [Mangrovibacterium diazotrophicum]|nr:hypothetical protein [Mangrovibacterium diazotrophicum]
MKYNQTISKQRKPAGTSKSEKLTISILIGLVIIWVLYRKFLEPETIGGDSRFYIFVFLIPTLLGIIILGFIRIRFLREKWNESKSLIAKIPLVLLYIVQGFLFSYLSIGLTSMGIWDYLNQRNASQSVSETVDCQIIKINSGTSRTPPNINFEFMGKEERINIDAGVYGQYFETNPNTIELQLTIKKGIWDYYIIERWKIKNNRYPPTAPLL